ncbi:MAG TPA: hypothetical protein VGA38_08800 [Candidatus Limnocylindria bacterium]
MRRPVSPIEAPAPVTIDLAERLSAMAERLDAMPAEHARSLSITVGWQGRTEDDVRELARHAGLPFGQSSDLTPGGDVVTVTFRRTSERGGEQRPDPDRSAVGEVDRD